MSTSIYKVKYKCDCGIDYGSCGAECAVIVKSQNSCDIFTLYHTDSHRYLGNHKEPKTSEGLNCFGDAYCGALKEALEFKEHNGHELTEQERKIIFG